MMTKSVIACFIACVACTGAFAPPAGLPKNLPSTQLAVRNPEQKASRFRAVDNEGKSAVKAFVEPSPPKSSGGGGGGGGGFWANLLGGGAKKAAETAEDVTAKAKGAASQVASKANGASTGGSTPNGDVNNSKWKASRFRVDPDRKEGKTAVRAFVPPSGGGGGAPAGKASNQSWTIPAKFNAPTAVTSRTEKYMRGAISARDMAVAMRKAGLGESALDIIGSMPEGEKRSALARLYKQV
eukprot:TRINITY_DN7450_c0_g1_i1.p1 TRINITY_DN7450_c0_g1~~TRINITY_DN7450_c0_g1_i1.p1  ORF type:complete len:264 (+),score=86.45 TRINITY_DN7450_c0_g1_i1:73-792(+)